MNKPLKNWNDTLPHERITLLSPSECRIIELIRAGYEVLVHASGEHPNAKRYVVSADLSDILGDAFNG